MATTKLKYVIDVDSSELQETITKVKELDNQLKRLGKTFNETRVKLEFIQDQQDEYSTKFLRAKQELMKLISEA